jgi:hypothetical protein
MSSLVPPPSQTHPLTPSHTHTRGRARMRTHTRTHTDYVIPLRPETEFHTHTYKSNKGKASYVSITRCLDWKQEEKIRN